MEDLKQTESHVESLEKKEPLEDELRLPGIELGGPLERRLVRKIDAHLIPLIMIIYIFSFLDRVNIGNARLYGLENDLGLHGQQFQTAVSLVFVTYILCETPSNMVLKKFTPSRWIAFICVTWGIISTLTGLVQTFGQLIACRLLLGAVEAGLFPGFTVYLTMWYTRKEIGLRVSYLLVCAALAGGTGGLLSYAIGKMDGISGMHGWRWILIMEGLPSVVLGVIALFLLPNDPETAYFLNAEDHLMVQARRAAEYGQTVSAQQFSRADSSKAFTDWKVWFFSFAQFSLNVMMYGFSTFLPTIIKALGTFTPAQVQLLTIPCYAVGAITYIILARVSDHYQLRGLPTICAIAFAISGYIILLTPAPFAAKYVACCMIAAGLYTGDGLPLAWLPSNCPRWGKRTTASGIQLTIGNAAGILAPFIYPTKQGPRYIEGHAITAGLACYAFCSFGFMWWYLARRNASRDAGLEDEKVRGMSDEDIAEMGDESPRYRFAI